MYCEAGVLGSAANLCCNCNSPCVCSAATPGKPQFERARQRAGGLPREGKMGWVHYRSLISQRSTLLGRQ